MVRRFLLFAFGFLVVNHCAFCQDFADEPITFSEMNGLYGNVKWVDLDRDGDNDAIMSNWVEKVALFRNDDGVMVSMGDALDGESFNYDDRSVLIDFDANGFIDILLSNGGGKVDVLLNQGNFDFTLQETGIDFVATTSSPLTCLDIDSDADLDIVVGGKIFLATEGGTFVESVIPLPESAGEYGYIWGDLNNDGLQDFININYSVLVPYIAQGEGIFEAKTEFASVRSDGTFFLTDAEGDGDLDIVISEYPSYTYAIFKNQFKESGQVQFVRGYTFPVSGGPVKISPGDSNRDGLVDFLVYGYLDAGLRTVVLLNTTTSTTLSFSKNDLQVEEQVTTSLNFVDFDGDGDLDVHMGAGTFSQVYGDHKIYLNEQVVPVVPGPAVPTGINTINAEQVTLQWSSAPKTFYQLEISRNGEIRFPSASMEDGTLMLPGPVSALFASEYTLSNLPAGNYQWRVQAIDHSRRTSAFTSWESFTLGNAPHSLALQSTDFTDVTLTWIYDEAQPDQFAVYRRSDSEPWTKIGEVPGTQLEFSDNTLEEEKKYEYAVRAVTGSSFSAMSSSIGWYTGHFLEREFARINPNIISGSAGVADIDGDKDYDFQFIGRVNSGNETAMDNDATGSFSVKSYLPATDWNNSYNSLLFLGDMDSDSDVDMCVLTGDSFGRKVKVLSNAGGVFTQTYATTQLFREFLDFEVKDFNNDGLVDVLYGSMLASWAPAEYHFLFQQRDGTFRDEELVINPVNSTQFRYFKSVDINNDGFRDIYFTGIDSPASPALLAMNREGEAFEVKQTSIYSHYDIHFHDFNADGNVDLMYKHYDNRLVMHLGAGNEVFGDPVFIRAFNQYGEMRVQAADLNFDGWPELVIHDDYNAGVMLNKGEGLFEVASFRIPGKWGNRLHLTDLEGDGDVDLLQMGNDSQHQGLNTLFVNQWKSASRTNSPPSAPTALAATVKKGAVTFSWEPSTDNSTPVKLITYNVQVTDADDKTWLHSGSDESGTFRNVFAPGNAGANTSFTVKNLPAGEYTLKVQAVDASFALSPWSTAQPFVIQAGPSNLQTERILLNKLKLTWTPVLGASVIVQRKTTTTAFQTIAELAEGATEYTDAQLPYNTVFTYRVLGMIDGIPTAVSDEVSWNTALWELKNTNLPNAERSIDVGDFTEDGRMDILMSGFVDNGGNWTRVKAVFENDESGFIRTDFGDVNYPNLPAATFSDLNNDAKLDLYEHGYVSGLGGYKTNLFKNNGNKTFSSFSNIIASENLEVMSYIDYDSDNDRDVYVVAKPNNGGYSARMLRNTGSGYENTTVFQSTCSSCSLLIVAGDFDRDGDEDAFRDGNLYLNTPTGMVSTSTTLSIPVQGKLHTLDFNGDGWLDVMFLSAGSYSYITSRLFRNNGLNTLGVPQFEQLNISLPAGSNAHLPNNAADFDHDGDLDLLFVAGSITFYSNNNDGTFKQYSLPKFTSSGQSITIDFDHDGDLDVLFTGYMHQNGNALYSLEAKLLENKLIDNAKGIVNNAPAQPVNLRTHQDAQGVHLMWDAPEDDLTPAAALTYDVILYKNGVPIHKSNITPESGARTRLEAGRSINKALLRNLVPGNYEWKVQAVDQAYRGSEFSALALIDVLPAPPLVKDTLIYKCDRTIALTAQGQNIQWFSDEAKSNLLASGTFSPTVSQTVFVTQTISGVRSAAVKVVITIVDRPAAPTVPHETTLMSCENNSSGYYLQANGEGVRWYSDESLTTNVKTGNSHYAQGPATFYVTQTIQGCESLPTKISLEKVIIDSRIVYEDGSLHVLEEDADYYYWYRNNKPIPGTTNVIDIQGNEGAYAVFMYKDGCYEASAPFLITATDENESGEFGIFPNPATDDVVISILPGQYYVNVFTLEGKTVFTREINGDGKVTFSVTGWSPGLYFVEVRNSSRLYRRKLMVAR
jgi:hypothetical protein